MSDAKVRQCEVSDWEGDVTEDRSHSGTNKQQMDAASATKIPSSPINCGQIDAKSRRTDNRPVEHSFMV